jgi:hypothetical protein
MAIVLRAVKGSALTTSELDGNFTDLDGRVTFVEDNPPTPVEIVSIDVSGQTITFTMSDASTFGPFTLPTTTQTPAAATDTAATTLTLGLANANTYIRTTAVTTVTVTVPPYSSVQMPASAEVHFRQSAAGAIIFAAGVGVTINTRADRDAATDTEGAVVTLKKVGTDSWDLFGDLVMP